MGNIICAPFLYPLLNRLGMRNLIIMASGFLTVGAFVRIFINEWFWFVIIGQLIMSASACIVINIQTSFCNNWFHPRNRKNYIAFITISNLVGIGVGSFIPLLFVDPDETNTTLIHSFMKAYMKGIALVCMGVFILVLFLFRDSPPKGWGLT
jgi:MFS family permease